MKKSFIAFVGIWIVSGCTVRGVDTKLTPQLYGNGEIVYIYSDLANISQPDQDPEAEKNRLKDLDDWVADADICQNGYEIVKRKAIATRTWSQGKKVYYLIRCK